MRAGAFELTQTEPKKIFTPNGDGLHVVSVVQIEKSKPKLLKIVKVSAK